MLFPQNCQYDWLLYGKPHHGLRQSLISNCRRYLLSSPSTASGTFAAPVQRLLKTATNFSYFYRSKAKVIEPLAYCGSIPVVVLTTSDAISSTDEAWALINRFASVDDVYSRSFAHTVVLQSNELVAQIKGSGRFSAVYHIAPGSPANALPPGPYFLSQGSIHQAYRLYDDELDSFIFGVIPEDVLNPKKSEDPPLNRRPSSF